MKKEQTTPQADLTVWEINGLQFVLDLEDADTADRYYDAFKALNENGKKVPKDGKLSDAIRAQCGLYRQLMHDIFGQDADKIFEGIPDNLRKYEEIVEDFVRFAAAQSAAAQQRRSDMLAQFRPNRAQRRAGGKK